MSYSVFEAILNRLGMVVMERLPHGIFLRVGTEPAPSWFSQVVLAANPNEAVTIGEALPFVGHFMDEAEAFWRKGRDGAAPLGGVHRHRSVRRADWPRGDRRDGRPPLVCWCSRWSRTSKSAAVALQSARENALEHEAHVGRTRALLEEIDDARALAQQLADSGLAAAPQQLALQIGEHLASLSSAVEVLAPIPDGVTRGRGR